MPKVNTNAAIPGNVKVAWKRPASIATTSSIFVATDKTATPPPDLYQNSMKRMIATAPKIQAFVLLSSAPAARVGETHIFHR